MEDLIPTLHRFWRIYELVFRFYASLEAMHTMEAIFLQNNTNPKNSTAHANHAVGKETN